MNRGMSEQWRGGTLISEQVLNFAYLENVITEHCSNLGQQAVLGLRSLDAILACRLSAAKIHSGTWQASHWCGVLSTLQVCFHFLQKWTRNDLRKKRFCFCFCFFLKTELEVTACWHSEVVGQLLRSWGRLSGGGEMSPMAVPMLSSPQLTSMAIKPMASTISPSLGHSP